MTPIVITIGYLCLHFNLLISVYDNKVSKLSLSHIVSIKEILNICSPIV